VLSFEMGLLRPGLMRQYGAVLGFPFGIEGIFFFLEAIFTVIYLYGWRCSPKRSNSMGTVEILTALGTPAGRADPYPLYASLHDIGEVIEFGPGGVLVVGYDAINSVLRDPAIALRSSVLNPAARWTSSYLGAGCG
jgi:Cytochrome bd terminal oxidase subunit I